MRKIILLLALVAALSTACPAQVNRTLYCYNATNGWIPLLSGAFGGGSSTNPYPAVAAYAVSSVDGTNVPVACDAKGNLIIGGSVSPALTSIQADTRSTSGYVAVGGLTTSAATVDAYSVLYQKTSAAGLTLMLETPTSTSAAAYLFNDNGTNGYTLQDASSNIIATVLAGDWLNLLWSGSTWSMTNQSNGLLPAQINQGGTSATTAAGARTNLGAAKSGANGDITSLTAIASISSPAATAATYKSGTTGAATFDSGATGAVGVGTGANAKTVTIGNTTGATAVNILSGTGGTAVTGGLTLSGGLGLVGNPMYTNEMLQDDNAGGGWNFAVSSGATYGWRFWSGTPGAGQQIAQLTTDGNFGVRGTVSVKGGANLVYRCTTAGTLPIGALTINTGNCSASTTTGLYVP